MKCLTMFVWCICIIVFVIAYFDASTLKEIFTNVPPIVFNRMLINEFLAHDWTLLLETGRAFRFLLQGKWRHIKRVLWDPNGDDPIKNEKFSPCLLHPALLLDHGLGPSSCPFVSYFCWAFLAPCQGHHDLYHVAHQLYKRARDNHTVQAVGSSNEFPCRPPL